MEKCGELSLNSIPSLSVPLCEVLNHYRLLVVKQCLTTLTLCYRYAQKMAAMLILNDHQPVVLELVYFIEFYIVTEKARVSVFRRVLFSPKKTFNLCCIMHVSSTTTGLN